ncbi:DHH family phosphoesterase [Alkalicoccus daliensis]|uniref:Phosphoesterase RecJ domain-containing protein n=1 Tax=Alkalicoccus daliensis TaxID=745820 RepID=A0A1H0CC95_9BACI|nr:bifunctional oligoribonuclease/PAP phosphatase NrnA [Alkalicoccus daliensis]SDN55492.1 phosphoesterase RecJ domain-containing protein [Alkalicoccus daliensis]
MTRETLFNIWETIGRYQKVIIHRHVRPDPDAVGSQAGLKEIILCAYPEKEVKLAGETENGLAFLTEMDEVTAEDYQGALAVVCDTANTARIDGEGVEQADTVIKIDHHPEVEMYGDLQWVDTEASSTCEMVYRLAEANGLEIPAAAARFLYAGIVADTGRFRFSNTTKSTFSSAGSLLEYEFDRDALYNDLDVTTEELLRLQGYVLSHVQITENGAAQVTLTKETLDKFKVTSKEASAIVNCFSNLKGLKAWVFFVEEDDIIRVRMRSKKPEIHHLAAEHQGGGHPMASGAQAQNWEETKEIFKKLDDLCKDA